MVKLGWWLPFLFLLITVVDAIPVGLLALLFATMVWCFKIDILGRLMRFDDLIDVVEDLCSLLELVPEHNRDAIPADAHLLLGLVRFKLPLPRCILVQLFSKFVGRHKTLTLLLVLRLGVLGDFLQLLDVVII